uniref:hypothetical protein n=1 Tax=Variovorax sp. BK018 TaxID=3450241 RepID=UPI00403A1F16
MPSGNQFRREQRSHQRQQTQWANRQFHAFRVPFERELAARRAAEAHQREQERLRTEAEARRLEELERERIREARRHRRQQKTLAKQQQKLASLAQQQLARQQQELAHQLALQQQVLLQQAIQQQFDQDNATLANLRAGLPALRAQCRILQLRVAALVRLLTGSGVAELAQLQADFTELGNIMMRCDLGGQSAQNQYQLVLACDMDQVEQVTRQAIIALQVVIQDHLADTAMFNLCALTAAGAEQTYQNARDAVSRYPNLGLTLLLILSPDGPINKLNNGELTRLNGKLAGYPAVTWVLARLPATRPHRTGEWLYVPETLTNFPYQPSAEVFHDWVWETSAGHGQSASAMMVYLSPIRNNKLLLGSPYVWKQGTNRNWQVSHPNLVLNVILNEHKTMLITFYKLG